MNGPSGPSLHWTYLRAPNDWFSTVIQADGTVTQLRRHRAESEASGEGLGNISAERAAALFAEARRVLPDPGQPKPEALESAAFPGFSATLRENDGTEREVRAPTTAVTSSSPLARLRLSVIAARRAAGGGWLRWSSTAGRLVFGFLFLIALQLFLTLRQDSARSALLRSGERLQARVVERHGPLSSRRGVTRFVLVEFQSPANGKQTARIEDYLSTETFTAATPGSEVRVLYDPAKKWAVLEQDISRYEKTKSRWWAVPLFLVLAAAVFLPWLGRWRIGTYDDGQEYLIRGDIVTHDAKDSPIPALPLNLGRFLGRL